MIIFFDIGNTSYHVLVQGETKSLYLRFFSLKEVEKYLKCLDLDNKEVEVYISSVNKKKNDQLVSLINKLPLLKIVPIDYSSSKTRVEKLGFEISNLDILAPDLLFDLLGGEESTLIADYGTASKLLLLDNNKKYVGGIIGPGLTTINKSLFKNTDLLPQIKLKVPQELLSLQTEDAINSSSTYGEAFKLFTFYQMIKKDYNLEHLNLIITGGDAKIISGILSSKLNFNNFTLVEDLVFRGMKRYLEVK